MGHDTGDGVGSTDVARVFGATVNVEASPRGLYLVIGRRSVPDGAVRSVRGEVMVRLDESGSMLAVLSAESHAVLQRHPDVALAGPVTIDPERFSRFVALAGLDSGGPPE